ncbi:MAG: SMC-Scp complex subunit ScpB [bacterium]|nr:SMC-Scp complex subunit ScpB [bacterium]
MILILRKKRIKMENLSEVILSVLFVSGESVRKEDIISKTNATEEEFNDAVSALKKRFDKKSGIVLLDFNGKLQLASNSLYSEEVSVVLNPIRERNLSKAMLETVAIIAYKQPITRLEIEEIRGVSSDYAINILLEHNLIEVVGRKEAVGRPVLFGTTDEFLKRFNLSKIDDLPDYNALLEQIEVMHTRPSEALYDEFSVPTDKIKHDEENVKEGEEAPKTEPKFEFLDIIKNDDEGEFV